jgi:hypothetical protein
VLSPQKPLCPQHQLIRTRSRQRAPISPQSIAFVLTLITLFVSPRRIARLGALIKPATLFKFHSVLVDRKYAYRVQGSLYGTTPAHQHLLLPHSISHAWRQHCRGLFQLPIAV